MKPRPRHELNLGELRALIGKVSEKDAPKIAALLDLATTRKLNETAARHGVTAQGLMKWRRQYTAGKIPATVTL